MPPRISPIREDLYRADAADGVLNGFLTPYQVWTLDPVLYQEARERRLFDNRGFLPYATPLDTFAQAWDFWKQIAGQSPENIPLGDALLLGNKMAKIQETVQITFNDPSGRSGDPLRILKAPFELSLDLVQISLGLSDPYFSREPEIVDDEAFYRVETAIYSDHDTDPEAVYQRAARDYLSAVYRKGLVDPKSELGKELQRRVLANPIYKEPTTTDQKDLIVRLSALLAYEGTFIYPNFFDCLLQSVGKIQLTFDPYQLDSREIDPDTNPFRVLYEENGNRRLFREGYYSPSQRLIALDADSLDRQVSEKGPVRIDPASYFYRGKSLVAHEVAHVFLEECYGGELSRRALALSGYFATRDESLFFDIFFGNLYGLAVVTADYDPRKETHSRLAELATIGGDFPEVANRRRHESVVGKFDEVRRFVEEAWGLRGHPDWAARLKAGDPDQSGFRMLMKRK